MLYVCKYVCVYIYIYIYAAAMSPQDSAKRRCSPGNDDNDNNNIYGYDCLLLVWLV